MMAGKRHKERKGQRDRGKWFFCFVPLSLCPFVPYYSTCFLTAVCLNGKRLFLFFPRRTDYGFKHAETKENHEKQGKAQQGKP
jgi:hypothetical protein